MTSSDEFNDIMRIRKYGNGAEVSTQEKEPDQNKRLLYNPYLARSVFISYMWLKGTASQGFHRCEHGTQHIFLKQQNQV